MDEWTEVKAKPKKKKAPKPQGEVKMQMGGKANGKLIPGAIMGGVSGSGYGNTDYTQMSNTASGLVEYDQYQEDYGEEFEEVKVEKVSHTCAQSVQQARLKANLTQAQLAQKIGEKTSVVVDIENATGPYVASQISNIENKLKCQIDRGRKKNRRR